jgi:hypothetical protein
VQEREDAIRREIARVAVAACAATSPLSVIQVSAGEETIRHTLYGLHAPEEQYVGFIAEDVPELVAMKDRKGLTPMDIVAVLTKVLQDQQKIVQRQQKVIDGLSQRVQQLEQAR